MTKNGAFLVFFMQNRFSFVSCFRKFYYICVVIKTFEYEANRETASQRTR